MDLPTAPGTRIPSTGQFPTTHFPFSEFPPEIRNLIYKWTFILSRHRSPEYNIPDFLVHGDEKADGARGGIRWMNVDRFPLLLTCKKIFNEALPMIAAEAYMEIKCYADEYIKRREKKAFATYATLLRTRELCGGVRKVVMNVTPNNWDIEFEAEPTQLPRLAGLLKDYKRLSELTIVIRPFVMAPDNWEELGDFFRMANKKEKGVSLCFELVDDEIDLLQDDPEDVEDIMEDRRRSEKIIEEMTGRFCGKGAEVWVEWNLREPVEYV
ncbi:hypothetical protein HYFRA_00004587 [Hymenoscyphus fraxineus]|uniref:Uncharacterized protein n=1 Tax=Hymenoscyphus fraxineus TaxID=746836 RepID=A0A9N9PSZ8_9HELO|nr:hypothetical protein HYFRA_00004587 [Hymenoscyphus fraxineus]